MVLTRNDCRPQVDIIDICLPAESMPIRLPGGEAGKHLIVEKPIDVTKEAAEKLIATADRLSRLAVMHRTGSYIDEQGKKGPG